MRKLLILCRVNLKALLSSVRIRGSKKVKATGIGALGLFAFLSVYISGIYSFMFADLLGEVGLLEYLVPLMALLGSFFSVMMTVYAAAGFIFSGKDTDLVLSLPVSAFTVMLSRITALYVENLVFIGLFMLTSGVAAGVKGLASPSMVIALIAGTLLLTFLTTLLTSVIAFIVSFITAKFPHHALFSTVLYFAFFLLILIGSFQMSNIGTLFINNLAQIDHWLSGVLLPFGLFKRAMDGELFMLLPLAGLSLLPFLLVIWLFSSQYKKILSALSARAARTDYRLGDLKAAKPFAALFRREVKRYFGSSIYFFNTGFGAVLLLIGAVYAAIKRDTFLPVLEQLGGIDTAVPLLAAAVGFLLATINTTCVSISIEGKAFWIIKEAPVSARDIFGAKILVNLLVSWPATVVSLLILSLSYSLKWTETIPLLAVMLALGMVIALFGLIVNLFFPRMDSVSDAMVVKNSASAMIGVFGGWVPLILLCLGYVGLQSVLSFSVYCLCAAAVLVFLSAELWHWLKKKGAEKLKAIC